MQQPIFRLRNISKTFPGVRALSHIDFDLYPERSTASAEKTVQANPR